MLDQGSSDQPRMSKWQSALKWGDIVSFRFPILEYPKEGLKPKTRPCLVIDRFEENETQFALLAYGTSRESRRTPGMTISISGPLDLRASGLHKPTCFQLCRQIRVPLSHTGFAWNSENKSPQIGSLPVDKSEVLSKVRKNLIDASTGYETRQPYRRFYGRRKVIFPKISAHFMPFEN